MFNKWECICIMYIGTVIAICMTVYEVMKVIYK